jgi:hypothetical protein
MQTFLDSGTWRMKKELDRFPVMSSGDSHPRAQRAASAS